MAVSMSLRALLLNGSVLDRQGARCSKDVHTYSVVSGSAVQIIRASDHCKEDRPKFRTFSKQAVGRIG